MPGVANASFSASAGAWRPPPPPWQAAATPTPTQPPPGQSHAGGHASAPGYAHGHPPVPGGYDHGYAPAAPVPLSIPPTPLGAPAARGELSPARSDDTEDDEGVPGTPPAEGHDPWASPWGAKRARAA